MTGITRFMGSMWHVFELFSTLAEKLMRYSVGIMILGMAALLSLYAINGWLNYPWQVDWSREIAVYVLVWCIFLMLGSTAKEDRHIKVPFLPYRALGDKRGKKFVDIAESLVGLVIAIYLSKQSWGFVASRRDMNIVTPSMNGWDYPMWIISLGIVIGFIFLSFIYFERSVNWTIELIASRRKGDEPGSGEAATIERQDDQAHDDAEGVPASQEEIK